MPLEARAELRAEEDRPRRVQEARGKVIDGAREITRASEYTIMIPAGSGVAVVDGTPHTDAALARKLEAAVKRDPSVKVRLGHDPKRADRAAVIRALVQKAGVTNLEAVTP